MSESSTLKLRPTSPLSVNRNVALNSALSWKIWLRLEDYEESINQAFSLQFGELDTIDDLKTKIFENLNTIRWSRVNDNASIALGFYCNRTDWEPDRFSPIQRLPTSPVNTLFGKSKPLQQPSAASTKRSFADNDSKSGSLNTSPRISASGSPKLSAVPRLPTARYGPNIGSPFLSVQNGGVNNNGGSNGVGSTGLARLPGGVAPTLSPLPFSGGRLALTSWSKKDLKHSVEPVGDSLYRILFEPDELVLTIYNELFGHLGSQAASDALLVFCNDIIPKHEMLPASAMDGPNFASNQLTQELLNSQNRKREQEGLRLDTRDPHDLLQPGLETPPTIGALNPGDAPPELVLDDTAAQLAREESEREFQLITNEEQLRKVSQSMLDEDNPDSPKQAILLLPKNFDGDVNFNESPSKMSSRPSSPLTTVGDTSNENTDSNINIGGFNGDNNNINANINTNTHNYKNNDNNNNSQESQLSMPLVDRPRTDDSLMQSHAPLIEKEVGMVHPLLENDRKKGLSSPTSPLLPRNPPPNFNRLSRSFAPKNGSSREKPFPGEWSATSDKVFPKINVLIVEDNVINQTILSSFLRKHKIFYKVAKNGQEAIDVWREGGIHLIFMDLQLPVLSGIDAAKKIRELEREHGIGIQKSRKTPHIESNKINKDQINAPVIIVAFTASKSQSDKKEALISGCNDYLTKPVNLHWLSNKINEWGCMQALINFDSWKEGQSRMTDNVLVKAPSQRSVKAVSGNPDIKYRMNRRRSRSSSTSSQSKISEALRLAP
ncbi:ZYRO0A11154p [Zygosaccharomyces rouxii]|uniref:ZYRO0A11154p n=1 Tax=Zygosaccharomyces rouxii (strain ATCC 2623 / CBS 732 / NBRC 1130 / NCYC 568 / NRRL Y-229) TaxID=559307 RepID=C5DQF8_ZYGRC|nr:uncharacterized protein ZYRO0A11154g [Zygosaccharomyces rouxii]KAH9198562.1 hypothetical protein LQ764DRAFT_226046 [Zygosaccharomyces rouxii]CAR25919.1 ZYRO0A11154p [Zygosaccharomyces rouxii]